MNNIIITLLNLLFLKNLQYFLINKIEIIDLFLENNYNKYQIDKLNPVANVRKMASLNYEECDGILRFIFFKVMYYK